MQTSVNTLISSSIVRRWRSILAAAAIFFIAALPPAAAAQGQTRSYYGCCPGPVQRRPVESTPRRVRRTYGGRVYMSFPNYDVMLFGAPQDITAFTRGTETEWVPEVTNELPPAATNEWINRTFAGGTVISRNAEGLQWDGNGFFLHPAYPLEDATRYRYTNRIVGQQQHHWPEVAGQQPADPRNQRGPFPVDPIVTYVQPSVEGQAAAVPGTTIRFLPAPWVVDQIQPPTEPKPTEPTEPSQLQQTLNTTPASHAVPYQDATMQFLPAPWVVAPTWAPAATPTLADKMRESNDATWSSPTTTVDFAAQPQSGATELPSHEQQQTVRHVLETPPVDCWSPQAWSSPECAKYRSQNRH